MRLKIINTKLEDGPVDPRFADLDDVIENRTRILTREGIGDNWVRIRPNHGEKRVVITPDNFIRYRGRLDEGRPEADALITMMQNVGLECDPADCGVYTLFHKHIGMLALVHAGRDGSIKRILERTIERCADLVDVPVEQYVSGLKVIESPMICGRCYQMEYLDVPSSDVRIWTNHVKGYFNLVPSKGCTLHEPATKNLHEPKNGEMTRFKGIGKIGVDFRGFNRERLGEIGVSEIIRNNICTYESLEYPSYLRFKGGREKEDRFMVIAFMRD